MPNEHLLVLSDDERGTAAIYVAAPSGSYDHLYYPFSTGEQVSRACSSSQHSGGRCRNLTILPGDESETYIVLAPLQNAVGLMELRYNGTQLLHVRNFTLSITSVFLIDDCAPLEIIGFDGRLIVLCLENLQSLRSCDIVVNKTDISRSVLIQCVHLFNFDAPIAEADYRYISNFVIYNNREAIFTAVGTVYGVRFNLQDARLFSHLGGILNCDRLDYNGDDELFYVYCDSGRTLVYDIDSSAVIQVLNQSAESFIPFACPHETPFEVQQTAHNILVRYDSINHRTPGRNFTFGKCYDRDTFFVIDGVEGTKVFHRMSGSFLPISNSTRDRSLLVFGGPYVVVQRTGPSEVVLYNPSFQPIVRLSRVAMAVGIIPELRTLLPTTTAIQPPMTTFSTSPMIPESDSLPWYCNTGTGGIVLWVILGLVLIFIIILVIILIMIFGYLYWR